MTSVFNSFDRIRIINLSYRTDRRRQMNRQLSMVGLSDDPRVQFFAAKKCETAGRFSSIGAHGAFLSHKEVLKQAAEANESILILEDDCDFLASAKTFIMPECDIFYGGYEASDPEDLINSDIIGAHFMGFSSAAARAATDYFQEFLTDDLEPDPQAASASTYDPNIRPPVDGAYVWLRRARPELKTEFAMLSFQRPSRTDIGANRWYDRLQGIRNISAVARKAKKLI